MQYTIEKPYKMVSNNYKKIWKGIQGMFYVGLLVSKMASRWAMHLKSWHHVENSHSHKKPVFGYFYLLLAHSANLEPSSN